MTSASPNRTARVLDRKAGRAAAAEELRRELSSAPPDYLEGALENPELTRRELLLLLRNRMAPGSLLQRIARERSWTGAHEVRRALVSHPRTPPVLSRNLLPHLFWRDLAEVTVTPSAHPLVRRQAESLLLSRLEGLSLGERIALARRATPRLIGGLINCADIPVLRGLLDNERLVESDATRIAAAPKSPPRVLAELAGHYRWGGRRSVRLALLANPRTPVPAALRLVGSIPQRDLQRLTGDANVPRIVRVAADRRLSRPVRPAAGQG